MHVRVLLPEGLHDRLPSISADVIGEGPPPLPVGFPTDGLT